MKKPKMHFCIKHNATKSGESEDVRTFRVQHYMQKTNASFVRSLKLNSVSGVLAGPVKKIVKIA